MENKLSVKKNLSGYLYWPLWLSIIWAGLLLDIWLRGFLTLPDAAVFFGLYLTAAILYCIYRKKKTMEAIVRFAGEYHCMQGKLLKELALPFAVLDENGHLLWGNNDFLDIIQDEKAAKRGIANVIPGLSLSRLPDSEYDLESHTQIGDRKYRVVLRRVFLDKDGETTLERRGGDILAFSDSTSIVTVFLHDETEIMRYIQDNQDQKMIIALVYIDNYEEVLESIDEVRRSLLVALIDRKVNKYMAGYDGLVKKPEKDKYIVMLQAKYLPQLKTDKFSILEEVRGINIGNEISATLSIGFGVGSDSYLQCYDDARASIDLALGRGGDQVVIRDGEKIQYYGGKNVSVEKNTRVKARVKAHALRELIEAKEKIVVMGHAIGDVDSLGAAVGIYRISKALNKRAYIVINDVTRSVKPVMDSFLNNPDYEPDMFINSRQAIDMTDVNTLLVVVDVNRINYTECPDLLQMTSSIVVLDHHRRTGEAIDTATLSYIEPYASSACEMVSEILQYTGDGIKLRPIEADAMYSGIMIDTDNFLTKTGVRTFEAAAYLKRNGADVQKIRKAFRNNMAEYKLKAKVVRNTEVYLEHYAIGECSGEGVDSPTIIGAQVANELLEISDIKASFVVTPYNGKIYISARAIDELNVQVVCEMLGGGGNPSVAGAQLANCTAEEAILRIKSVLDKMKQEGDL